MSDAVTVEHDKARQRFVIRLDGQEAHLAYRQQGQELYFRSTFVPDVFRGRGFAEQLVDAGYAYAASGGFTVRPTCAYVSGAYLKRHPEHEVLTRRTIQRSTPNPEPPTPNRS